MKYRLAVTWILMSMLYGCGKTPTDQIINKPGVYDIEGPSQLKINVEKHAEGKLRFSLTDGRTVVSPTVELGDNWFVFPESSGRVWYFNGSDDLSVFLIENNTATNISVIKRPSLMQEIPKGMLAYLPDSSNPLYPRPSGGAGAEGLKKQILINNADFHLRSSP